MCHVCIFICEKGVLSFVSPYSSIKNLKGLYPYFLLTLYIADKSVVTMSTVSQLWLYETAVIVYRCVKRVIKKNFATRFLEILMREWCKCGRKEEQTCQVGCDLVYFAWSYRTHS